MADPAIQALYVEHHDWLCRWLGRQLRSRETARDVSHDVFLRLLGRTGELHELIHPRAYLARIARGLVMNRWRRQALERAYLEAVAAWPAEQVPDPALQTELLDQLCEIDLWLARLPERPRTAFLMAQLDGCSYRDIAATLAVSERMVKKYMAQAMLHCLQLRLRDA